MAILLNLAKNVFFLDSLGKKLHGPRDRQCGKNSEMELNIPQLPNLALGFFRVFSYKTTSFAKTQYKEL